MGGKKGAGSRSTPCGKFLLFVVSNDLKLFCNFFRMVDQLGKTLRANDSIQAFVPENEQRTFLLADTAVEAILFLELLTHTDNPFIDAVCL